METTRFVNTLIFALHAFPKCYRLNSKWLAVRVLGAIRETDLKVLREADAIFTGTDLAVTLLATSFYWENVIYIGSGPQRGPDGSLNLVFPMGDKRLPGIASDDIGKCALAIFRRGDEYIGKTVSIAGEHLTGAQLAASISRAMRRCPGLRASIIAGFPSSRARATASSARTRPTRHGWKS